MQTVKIISAKPLPFQAYFFVCFDQNVINIKWYMKSVTFIVLQPRRYENVLFLKYFCTTTNFWRTYVRTRIQCLLNPACINGDMRWVKETTSSWAPCSMIFLWEDVQWLMVPMSQGKFSYQKWHLYHEFYSFHEQSWSFPQPVVSI